MKCPICGRAELVRTTCEEIYTYKGQSLVIPSVTGDHCAVCDELILDGEDTERVMNLLLAFNKKVNASADGAPDLTRTPTPDKLPAAMPVPNPLMAGAQVGLGAVSGGVVVPPHVPPRYTMAELLAASNYSHVQHAEEREWADAPAVGSELECAQR